MSAINTIRELIATLPLEAQPIGYAINEQLDRISQPISSGVSDEVVERVLTEWQRAMGGTMINKYWRVDQVNAMRAALQSVWPGEKGEGHKITGTVIACGRDPENGINRLYIETTFDQLLDSPPMIYREVTVTIPAQPPAGAAQGDATAWRFTFPDGYKSQWYELPAVDPLGAEIIEFQYPWSKT